MRSFFRKFSWLVRRRTKESDLLDEISFHLSEEAQDHESAGLSADDARRAARLAFGNALQVQEDVRAAWSWTVLDQFWQDLTYAARGLWRSPGFTLGAIAVLALGMGANLALLQIFDAATVHRYSIPGAESFVRFSRTSRDDPGGFSRNFPSAAVDFYRANSSSFASLISEDTSFPVIVDGTPGRRSNFVSDNYFPTVGIFPVLGRVFDSQDSRFDAPAVALLGHSYWKTQYGADPNVLGRIIQVNHVPVQIVGVLPEEFDGFSPVQADLWFPLNSRRSLVPGSPTGQAAFFGRLKPGTGIAPVAAELTALTRELAHEQPRFFNQEDRIQAELVQDSLVHFLLTRSPAIFIFVGTVLLVLLSACSHLGSMLQVRGLARQNELAIRIAIGASRGRLIRQLVTENTLLAVLGSVAGLNVGIIAARVFVLSGDSAIPFDVSMHWQTAVACVVMIFISVFAVALPAARETTRAGFSHSTLRSRFLDNQIAVSCVLLIVTGVFVAKAFLDASLDLTFDYRNTVLVDPQLLAREGTPESSQRRLDALAARFRALPGVESVAVATGVPLRGRVIDNFPQYPRIQRSAVSPSFFDVMEIPLLRGRTFLPGEQDAVIASEAAARTFWPNQDPLGQGWEVAGVKRNIVGVVRDSWPSDLGPGLVEAYLPILNRDIDRCQLVLRTRGDPAALIGMIPRVSAELNESVSVTPMSEIRDAFLQLHSPVMKIFGSIATVATALAAAGLFALMAFTVVQKRKEIGIRIAIGATRRDLLAGLLQLHAKALGRGMFKGAIGGVILLLFIRAVVSPEPWQEFFGGFAVGMLFFAVVAVVATLIPALRALRIDPSEALRVE